jgi:hypothetical protein
MIKGVISHYKILEKLGEPCLPYLPDRQAAGRGGLVHRSLLNKLKGDL